MDWNYDTFTVPRLYEDVMAAINARESPSVLLKGLHELFPGNLFHTESSTTRSLAVSGGSSTLSHPSIASRRLA